MGSFMDKLGFGRDLSGLALARNVFGSLISAVVQLLEESCLLFNFNRSLC